MFLLAELIPVSVALSLLIVLLICTATDLSWHRIPNTVLLPALMVAIVLQTSSGGLNGLLSAVAGAIVGLVFLMPHYAMGGMGAGDVKLLGVVGAFLGPWSALVAGAATLVAGAILGIAYILWRSLGPMMSYQVWKVTQLQFVSEWQATAPISKATSIRGSRFAYAPAIAAGAIFAMWQQGLLAKLVVVI